jgi:hypothetical protein
LADLQEYPVELDDETLLDGEEDEWDDGAGQTLPATITSNGLVAAMRWLLPTPV